MTIPFDEDTMTIILGLGCPEEPGPHGPMTVPAPDKTAIDLAIKIRDLCEEFLAGAGKCTEDKGMEPEEEQCQED